jgi:transposase
MKETAISIRREGARVWRGKCNSDPARIAQIVRKRAPDAVRVVFETGPLSVWFYHALKEERLPVICIDARHAKAALAKAALDMAALDMAALDMAANKTVANDAYGLAQLAEVGFYREVRVKGYDSILQRRALDVARRDTSKGSLSIKLKRAGWDDAFLLNLIN